MATIRKLIRKPSSNRSLWQAQVRKKGIPPLSKCFKSKSEAVLWAQTAESEIDRNLYVDCSEADQTTLTEAMNRYGKEILPYKAGYAQDMSRTKVISKYLGGYFSSLPGTLQTMWPQEWDLPEYQEDHYLTARAKRLWRSWVSPWTIEGKERLL